MKKNNIINKKVKTEVRSLLYDLIYYETLNTNLPTGQAGPPITAGQIARLSKM